MKMTKLPKDLFVVLREKGTENEYMFATTNLEDLEDGEMFGRYKQTSLEKIERTTVTRLVIKRKIAA